MACPSHELLEGLAAQRLAEPLRTSVERHRAGCAACAQLVAEMRANLPLLERLAAAPPAVERLPTGIPGYDVLATIQRAAHGGVYRAVQSATGRTVALKLLRFGRSTSVADHRRFDREIAALTRLIHPNIVRILDAGRAGGQHFLVMEFVDGTPLLAWVDERALSVEQALEFFVRLCRGVAYAHALGVVHRDLKPGNILVDRTGEPRIVDFGLAKLLEPLDDSTVTHSGVFVGTPGFASPEQLQGDARHSDARADVYALGVILYQLLTGRPPSPRSGSLDGLLSRVRGSPRPKPSAWRPEVGADVDVLVMRALAIDPKERHASAAELLGDLQGCLQRRGDPPGPSP